MLDCPFPESALDLTKFTDFLVHEACYPSQTKVMMELFRQFETRQDGIIKGYPNPTDPKYSRSSYPSSYQGKNYSSTRNTSDRRPRDDRDHRSSGTNQRDRSSGRHNRDRSSGRNDRDRTSGRSPKDSHRRDHRRDHSKPVVSAVSSSLPRVICEECKRPGHAKTNCYKLHPELRPPRVSSANRTSKSPRKKTSATESTTTPLPEIKVDETPKVNISEVRVQDPSYDVRVSSCDIQPQYTRTKDSMGLTYKYTSNYPFNKPVLAGKVNSVDMPILLDCGADISLIGSTFLAKHLPHLRLIKLAQPCLCLSFNQDSSSTRHPNSSVPKVEYMVIVTISFLDFKVDFPVHCLPGDISPMILGNNFLTKLPLLLSPGKSELTLPMGEKDLQNIPDYLQSVNRIINLKAGEYASLLTEAPSRQGLLPQISSTAEFQYLLQQHL